MKFSTQKTVGVPSEDLFAAFRDFETFEQFLMERGLKFSARMMAMGRGGVCLGMWSLPIAESGAPRLVLYPPCPTVKT